MHYIYTNITGVFVFNSEWQLVERYRFKKTEFIKINKQLETGNLLKKEESLVTKYKNAVIIGPKRNSNVKAEFSQDTGLLAKASALVDFHELRESNLAVTSKEYADSFSLDKLIIHAYRMLEELDQCETNLRKRLLAFLRLCAPATGYAKNEPLEILNAITEGRADPPLWPVKLSDIEPFKELAEQIRQLIDSKQELLGYVENWMKAYCPNLYAIAGLSIAAKLLGTVGSLKELAELPYTKLQLLGAEKALFRHVRKGNKPPKHGFIVTHPLVANATNKGKAARLLAEKLSLAVRVDYFSGEYIADKLVKELKRKIK